MLIEVCANSVESALAAQKGGAKRVELCENLYEGGTTPSYGAIELAREMLSIDLHVLIRPRGGDFLYSPLELEIMKRDIEFVKKRGVDGVVIGVLTPEGKVDKAACHMLLEAAYPMRTTFHRAFDMTREPEEALEDIIHLGFNILLTSGLQTKAYEGISLLQSLVKQAKERISIMPGSGICEDNIVEIAKKTQAKEFHVSLRKKIESNMVFRNNQIRMGGIASLSEYETSVTDEARVRALVGLLKQQG